MRLPPFPSPLFLTQTEKVLAPHQIQQIGADIRILVLDYQFKAANSSTSTGIVSSGQEARDIPVLG
jgi:hypothetical protein